MAVKIKGCRVLRTFTREDHYEVHAENSKPLRSCPHCNGRVLNGHGTVRVKFHHTPHDMPVLVMIDNVRFQCISCSKTTMEPIAALHPHYRATVDLVDYLIERKREVGFAELSKATGLNQRTIRRITDNQQIDQYTRQNELRSSVIGITTYHLGRDRLVVSDATQRHVIDTRSSVNPNLLAEILSRLSTAGLSTPAFIVDFNPKLILAVEAQKPEQSLVLINLTSIHKAAEGLFEQAYQQELKMKGSALDSMVVESMRKGPLQNDNATPEDKEECMSLAWPMTHEAASVLRAIQGALAGHYADGWQVVLDRILSTPVDLQELFQEFMLLWDIWEEQIRSSLRSDVCDLRWVDESLERILEGSPRTYRYLKSALPVHTSTDHPKSEAA